MKYINSNLYAFGMVAFFVLLVLVTALHAQSVRRDDKASNENYNIITYST